MIFKVIIGVLLYIVLGLTMWLTFDEFDLEAPDVLVVMIGWPLFFIGYFIGLIKGLFDKRDR